MTDPTLKALFRKDMTRDNDRNIYLIAFLRLLSTLNIPSHLQDCILRGAHVLSGRYDHPDMPYVQHIQQHLSSTNFHDIVEYYNQTFERDAAASHYTPISIVAHMMELAHIQSHETVADFFGGTGKILEQAPPCKALYHNDRYFLECLVARMALRERSCMFFQENWFTYDDFPCVDVIVTNIPFLSPAQNTAILDKIKTLCDRAVVIVPSTLMHHDFEEVKILPQGTFPYTNVASKIVMWRRTIC